MCFLPHIPPPEKRETGQYKGRSLSAKPMPQILKYHARKAGEHTQASMHSFRSGGGVSRALPGESTSTIIGRTVLENPANGLDVHAF